MGVTRRQSHSESSTSGCVSKTLKHIGCFANYLIDGHHKVEAAALEATPVTVLSFIFLDHSQGKVPYLIDLYKNPTKPVPDYY